MTLIWPQKDADADLDYKIDWSAWLDGDTIASSTWTVPSGITKDRDSHDTSTTTIWLSGGTVNETYSMVNRIVTASGRTDERTVKLRVISR